MLGLPRTSGKKADQGTIVHKVMEILANCRKLMQDTKDKDFFNNDYIYTYNDEHIGIIEWTDLDFMPPTALTNEEIDIINKTRINKQKYKPYAKLKYGAIHYGVDMVTGLIDRAYKYYAGDDWTPIDKKDCVNWTWMALEYKDGIFDPRKHTIHAAEPRFDFLIEKEWARYNWTLPSGEEISGFLGIKGTIDLITKVKEGIIEITDFKTGQRIDWSCKTKNNEKTYKKLCNDFQLMLYYYAAKQLYPEVKQIIVSIFFIRDGGPFTIHMDESTIIKVENKLRKRFQEISKCQLPAMQDATQRDFRCTRICDYYNMVAPNGENMCKFIHQKIQDKGIDYVTKKYTQDGFSIGKYQAPGEKKK